LHGDSTGKGEENNVEANNNSGGRGAGRPICHKIPIEILIFLVFNGTVIITKIRLKPVNEAPD